MIERTSEDAFLRRVASQCGPVFVFWLAQAVSDGEGALAARLVRVAERLDLSLPDDVAGRLKDSSIVDTGKLLPATASSVRHLRVPLPTVLGRGPVKSAPVLMPSRVRSDWAPGVAWRACVPSTLRQAPPRAPLRGGSTHTSTHRPLSLHPRLSYCRGCRAPMRDCQRGARQAQAPSLSAGAPDAAAAVQAAGGGVSDEQPG